MSEFSTGIYFCKENQNRKTIYTEHSKSMAGKQNEI